MTYHLEYMLTPFFNFPGRFWSSPSDRGEGRKEWLRLKRSVEVEGMRESGHSLVSAGCDREGERAAAS